MKNLALIITASFFLFSCSDNSTESYDKSLEVKTNDIETQQITTPSETNANNDVVVSNEANTDANTVSLNTTQSIDLKTDPISNNSALKPAVVNAGKTLNPPHGQPNHRCDIAVGEPLSTPIKSAPVQNITQQAGAQSAPQIISTPALAPAVPKVSGSSTAKLNPPHGESGHDCAIQVGAPLN